MTCEADPLDFGSFTKLPSENYRVKFDFATTLSKYIEFGKLYRTDAYLLPRRPTGFAYRVISDGNAGAKEPVWPVLPDVEVKSGSLRMVSVPAMYHGIDIITNAEVEIKNLCDYSDSTSLVAVASSWEGPEAEITVSQGLDKNDYLIAIKITTLSGQQLAGVALCSVRYNRPTLCVYS